MSVIKIRVKVWVILRFWCSRYFGQNDLADKTIEVTVWLLAHVSRPSLCKNSYILERIFEVFLFSFATIVSLFSPIIAHKYLLFKTDVTVYAYNAKRNALAKVSFVRMSETK